MADPESTLSILMDELAEASKTTPGLSRAHARPIESINPPCLVVPWPIEIEYDQTYQGGLSQVTFDLVLVLGRAGTSKANRNQVAAWLSGDLKTAIEAYDYTGEHTVTVTRGETDIAEIGDIAYLGTVFTTEVFISS